MRCVVMPGLTGNIRRAGATNRTLAIAAGVAERTVCNARVGKPVLRALAVAMTQALEIRIFQRDRRGAK